MSTTSSETSRGLRITLLIARILVAFAFLAAGASKLMGVPEMVKLFDSIGFGQWFRYLTAAVEIGGAILLLLPATIGIGAFMLACTMVGALVTHAVVGGSPVPAMILFALNLFILWFRRGDIARFSPSERGTI